MAKKASSAEPRPTSLPKDWKAVAHMPGFHSSIGFSIDPSRSAEGIIAVTGRIDERHLNINGVVHGGVYCTLLDTAMGAAVVRTLAPDEITATTSLYVDFLRPAKLGQVLTSRGSVTRRGRHIAFADGRIHDDEDHLVGTGRGTWYIWKQEELPVSTFPSRSPSPAGAKPRR